MADIEPTPRTFPDIALETLEPPPTDEQTRETNRKDAILALARKRIRAAETAMSFFREWSRRDQQFAMGTWGDISYQWPDKIQGQRLADDRPCLTINRTRGFIRMVSNTARSANLRIQVNPVDDKGDPKLAQVLQGIIRNIERTSFAEHAYATAADKQAEQGLSFFRFVTEWADDTSFRQRIKIKAVRNPRRVVFDPAGVEEPDFSACEYVFYITDIEKSTYEAVTGNPPPEASGTSFAADTEAVADWFPNDKIRIANYYCVERTEYTLYEMTDTGEALTEEQFKTFVRGEFEKAREIDPFVDTSDEVLTVAIKEWAKNPAVVRRQRQVRKKQWWHRIITPTEILEESPWPGSSHPLIPVIGELLENPDTGEIDFRGIPRDAQDAAKAYNVEVSGLVEDIGLGHKAPVVGYKGQFGQEGSAQRAAWEMANRKPLAFLEVEPFPQDDGRPWPLPIRNSYSPPIEATILGIRQSDEDLKSTAGYHDASMGERGPQESRVAIQARQRQDEHANSHYLFNLRLALACGGKQLIELIRVVYDVPQVVRITGDGDMTQRVLVYSGASKDPRRDEFREMGPDGQRKPFTLPKGVDGIYDLSVGEFDVEVTGGPSPGTRRQDAVSQMVEIMKVVTPPQAAAMAPMLIRKTDVPDAEAIAAAANRALPPQLQEEPEEDGGPKIPPQVQARMAAMQQAGEAMSQKLKELEETVRTKKLELMARHMSDRLKAWLELTKLAVQEQNADRRLLLEKQLDVAHRFLQVDMDRLSATEQQPAEAPLPPEAPMPPAVTA